MWPKFGCEPREWGAKCLPEQADSAQRKNVMQSGMSVIYLFLVTEAFLHDQARELGADKLSGRLAASRSHRAALALV